MGDLALRVAPDLRAGAGVMREGIIGIGKLIQNQPLARIAHALGRVARKLHAALFGREHELGAESRHRLPPFDTQMLGHHEHHAIAAHRCHHRERDAGIAAGGLDQGVARLDEAAALGAEHHRERRAVLYRAGRVVALQFGEKDIGGLPRNALQAHEGRVANEVIERGAHKGDENEKPRAWRGLSPKRRGDITSSVRLSCRSSWPPPSCRPPFYLGRLSSPPTCPWRSLPSFSPCPRRLQPSLPPCLWRPPPCL